MKLLVQLHRSKKFPEPQPVLQGFSVLKPLKSRSRGSTPTRV
jgi:hypothetical protein